MKRQLDAELENINFSELNFFAPTNINDADTLFINNSVIGEVQRLTWSKLKSNIKVDILPNYTVKVNSSSFEFNDQYILDLSPAFNGFVKTDGSTLMLPSYLPTQPKHIATKDYIDLRTAYSFQYKDSQTIGGYLDLIPNMLTAYLLADGTRLLPNDYTPTQNKQIATKDYVDASGSVAGYIKANGSVPFTGTINAGGNSIINLTDPVNTQDGATKNYIDNKDVTNYKLNGSALPTADLNMNSHKITSVANPTSPQDVVTKSYTDSSISSVSSSLSAYAKLDGTTVYAGSLNLGNNKIINVSTPTVATDGVSKSYADSVVNGYVKADGTVAFTSNINANLNKVINLLTPTSGNDAVNKTYADNIVNGYIKADGTVAFTGIINANSNKIIGLSNPTTNTDGANKIYVDTVVSSVSSSLSAYAKLDGSTPYISSLNMNNNKIINLTTPTLNTDATTKAYTDTADNLRLKLDGTSLPTANITLNSNKLISVADPTSAQDGATKNYVDTQNSNYLKRDGTNSPTANIPMANFKFTGLSAGTANGQALRYDEFATAPKLRIKSEKTFTGLNIPLTTTMTAILASLPDTNWDTTGFTTTAVLQAGKIRPLNQPTALNIQIILGGTFTVGALAPVAYLSLNSVAGSSTKPYTNSFLGSTGSGTIAVYNFTSYEIDVGGNAFTNGIAFNAATFNTSAAAITSISWVISQYNT